MRLIHLADTHLGYSAGSNLSPRGINQREEDVLQAFDRVICEILRIRPDMVLHCGDLFDSVRPTNRTIKFAFDRVCELSDAGMDTVLISGNHSTPRMRETGSIFSLFERMPHIHPVHSGRYERLEIADAVVHAVPHGPALTEEVARVRAEPSRVNILSLHAGVDSLGEFRGREFNEQVIPVSLLPDGMDYIAMGHYHRSVRLRENAYYSGSTERFSFLEADEDKVYLEVHVGEGGLQVTPHPVPVRRMLDLEVECIGLDAAGVENRIRTLVDEVAVEGAVVRLRLLHVPAKVSRSLDMKGIRSMFSGGVMFRLFQESAAPAEGTPSAPGMTFLPFAREWKEFMRGHAPSGRRRAITDLGIRYLEGSGGEDTDAIA